MSAAKRSPFKTLLFVCFLTILGSIAILLVGEIAVRIRWAIQHKDAAYLMMGFGNVKAKTAPTAVASAGGPAGGPVGGAIALPTINGTKQWNPCVQREIYFRVNSAGGRGPEWNVDKPAGALRVLAIGESSTFGAANDEEQTWPALLEGALRARGMNVEVLNFGIPGQRVAGMISDAPAVLDKYHPDVVVHYGGYNETWDNPAVPNWFSSLNYRSALYTYIYEKMYFRAEQSPAALVPNGALYERKWTEFANLVKQHGASLIAVSQAVEGGADARMGRECARLWRDKDKLAACLNDVVSQPNEQYTRLQRTRMMKTVVLQQVQQEVAAKENVPVIDQRGTIVETPAEHLFCDEIHLTDKGNQKLVSLISEELSAILSAKAPRKSGS